ncbi:hypothetical protein ESZ36_16705 [Colwellia demingiae]|uniref:Uncharacterized protein n=1 Tax=Colwellia demingiae TaxID=89401 RepID=A0A5C6QB51_9GAMM|nr:hypothetical protein [Colwellia demingiae]TWX65943.1 hypothetical protein ESZ36_16705 [Colwellia demingiae]
MTDLIKKAKTGYKIIKFIKNSAFRFAAFICGYVAASFYTLESFQLIIAKANQIEGVDKVFNVQDIIIGKLTSVLAIFFFITSGAMYYFWKNQGEIDSINIVLKKIRFILKIPSSFLYMCWFFISGFSLYAYLNSGQVGVGIFTVGTILFAIPALMFSYWLKDDFFKPIEKDWQKFLYPWVIVIFTIATGTCFLYSPIDFFLDLPDWYNFIHLHFVK